jgi:hypothetical protein
MASPFRLRKKARRRERKQAKRFLDEETLATWNERCANSFGRIGELILKQANAKRRKKRPQKSKSPAKIRTAIGRKEVRS